MTAGLDPSEPLSVLVVDDPDTADSMVTVLKHSGHRAVAAYHGAAALAAAAADPPDVVLVEPWLAGTAGFRVARDLRAPAGRVPPLLVAVTGYGAGADRARTAAAGFHLHLVKPADPAVVVGVLARFGRLLARSG